MDINTNKPKYINGWQSGGSETKCGFGSRLDQTMKQRIWIPFMVDKYAVQSICDVGAGDLNWMQAMGLPLSLEYTALDLVPRHPIVQEFNMLTQVPPKVDLLLCLWVLNHFAHTEARIALTNLRESGSKYMMITWHDRLPDFLDLTPIETVVIRERTDTRGDVEIRLVRL